MLKILHLCHHQNDARGILCLVDWSLPEGAAKMLVQVLISCCLDYCNALLYGIKDTLFRRLQSIQNAAVCLLTGARQCNTGFQWSSKSSISWPLSSTSRSIVKPHRNQWTTASRLFIPDTDGFAPQTPASSSSHEHTFDSEIEVSWLRDQEYETVFPCHCDSLTLN